MGASASEIRAGGAFVEVNADTDKAKKKLSGVGAALDDLKKKMGEDSRFGGVFKILAGTGAVAGLGLASRLLGDMTGKAADLAGEFRSGQKSAGEVTEELMQSLPILGDIRKAGVSIQDLWSGEAEAVRKVVAEAERVNASVEARRRLLAETNRQWKDQRDIIAGMAAELQLVGKRGLDAQVQGVRNAAEERERGFRRSAADDVKKLTEEAGKSPEAAKDLKNAVASRQAAMTTQIAQSAADAQFKINALYEAERQRLRGSNAEREQRVNDLRAEAAAADDLTGATRSLTDAEQAQLERQRERIDLGRELAEDVLKAQKEAEEQLGQVSTNDEFSQKKIRDDLAATIKSYEDLYDAKLKAMGQRGAAAQLDSFFSPMEEAHDSATSGGGIMGRLDAVFGPLEDAYEDLKSRVWDVPGGSFGTFSASMAEQGGGTAVQKLTDIARYSKLQYEWSRRQIGATFR